MAKLNIWTSPGSYAGYDPVGHILVASRHRDSDALTRSNWVTIGRHIAKIAGVETLPDLADLYEGGWPSGRRLSPEEMPAAYTFSASHCLVGWVEYMLVRPDAPQELLDAVQELADDLDGYPVFDEDHWSEFECDEANEFWASMSVKERLEVIKRHGTEYVSIFAARHPWIPQGDNGYIQEYCLGH